MIVILFTLQCSASRCINVNLSHCNPEILAHSFYNVLDIV